MEPSDRPDVKYLPCQCPFLQKGVWAVLTQRTAGWRIVNCLDKDQVCFPHGCAFTTDGGEWPFAQRSAQDQLGA
jgi:hypothetical protein